jgi:hypothetical protein
MEQAVMALLTARNQDEAAESVGISPRTLQRWQKLPEFERAFREARMTAFRQQMARLQQATVPAVTTLLKIRRFRLFSGFRGHVEAAAVK